MGATQERIWDRVVVGGGVAGLIVAWRAAGLGQSVLLLEAQPRFGGTIGLMPLEQVREAEPSGLRLEVGAESFATKSSAVRELIEELGLSDRISPVSDAGSWILARDERGGLRAQPSPKVSLLGIPGDLASSDVQEFLGREAAEEALRLDSAPVRDEDFPSSLSLAETVRLRMGESVLQRLVSPIVSGVYSVSPEEIDSAVVHPRLLEALREQGSLAGAVRSLRAKAPAGAAVAGLDGGIGSLAEELVGQARQRGATLIAGARVDSLSQAAETGAASRARFTVEYTEADGSRSQASARRVDLAVPADSGMALLRGLAPDLLGSPGASGGSDALDGQPSLPETFSPGPEITLVTLVFAAGSPSSEGLSRHPRGTGILAAPAARRSLAEGEAPPTAVVVEKAEASRQDEGTVAKALTHATAKWSWLRAKAEGREAVRLSFNSRDLPEDADDDLLTSLALADAAVLTGCSLSADDLEARAVARHRNAVPFVRRGMRDSAVRTMTGLLEDPRLSGLGVVGAWAAGTGLAAVVAHAQAHGLDSLE